MMHRYRYIRRALMIAALPVIGAGMYVTPAAAQAYNYGNPAVATVTDANGNVTILRGDGGAQVAATVNAPLLPGDYIATSPGSDAEVQFDGISMVRLAGNTQLRLVNLGPKSREVQLASGTAELAELQGADGDTELDTPPLSVRPNQTGDYRISVFSNGETLVTVRSGEATVSSANGSQTLGPGSTLVANGSSLSMQGPIAFDSFDQFNIARDQAAVSAYNQNPYLSPQLAGYSNLANYGQWQNVPGYGYAWAPNNQAQTNFAPYQNGQWAWEPAYGYTWVDNAPYGYPVSHYGTWFNNPNYGGWLWQPPAYQVQTSSSTLASSWLPAVVSFFLSGNNGTFGAGFTNLLGGVSNFSSLGSSPNASIGWIPLAPGEQYQPWYGQNYAYPSTGLTNISNITNVYNYYSNARYYGGTAMVPLSAWRAGNFKHVVSLRPQQFKRIALIRGAVPIVPTKANLHYSSAATVKHPMVLSRMFATPRFAAKARAIKRVSFATQQAKIRSIAVAHARTVALPPRPARLTRPVYRPKIHATIHLEPMKPVASRRAPVMKPIMHRAAPLAKPALRRAAPAKPVVHRAAPLAKPVMHRAAPLAKPVVHRAAPVARPVIHPAAPVARPVVHRAAPVARPIVHRAPPLVKPIVHPVAPAARPVPRQVPAHRPAAPVPNRMARPIAHPVSPAQPAVRRVPPGAHPIASPAR